MMDNGKWIMDNWEAVDANQSNGNFFVILRLLVILNGVKNLKAFHFVQGDRVGER